MRRPWYEIHPQFLAQLTAELRAAYPDLHIYQEGCRILVRGSFPIAHDGTVLDRYLIEVELPDDYPASIPVVREIGGRIPRTYDYHIINEQGEACLFLPEQRWWVYPPGTTFVKFLNGPVRHFFLGQSLVRRGEPWPFGEWGHGAKGTLEFYAELLGTSDLDTLRRYVEYLTQKHIKAHWSCPCGSGTQLRYCHIDQLRELRMKIPKSVARQSAIRLALLHRAGQRSTSESRANSPN
jgi:hypothetical protein